MEPKKEEEQSDSFPKIPDNDFDDENPYKADFENVNKFKKSDTIKLDPEKDNISDQLGLEFDYPTQANVFGNEENNEPPKPYNDNNVNNDRNILDNFDKPVEINELPNNNIGSNNNNNLMNNNNYGNNNNFNQNNNNYPTFGGTNNFNKIKRKF